MPFFILKKIDQYIAYSKQSIKSTNTNILSALIKNFGVQKLQGQK